MTAFLVRRILQAVVVLFGVSVVVFILIHLLPGGPARALLGTRANTASILAFNRQHGLLQPWPIQYITWVRELLQGNLGFSYKQNQSVDSLLGEDIPRTALLAGTSTVLALMVAIPIGVLQAMRRNKMEDYVLTAAAFILYSVPSFFLGIVLIILLSDVWPLFPSTGPNGTLPLSAQLANLVLPVLTLTLVTIAFFSRYMRSSVLEVLVQDYVRTAVSKGVSQWRIAVRHVLRNAMLPILTLVGLSLPGILSGALIVEVLFNYPGMGLLFWNGAVDEDFPVMLGATLVVGAAVVLGSLLADVLYAIADPRVRY
jgi:peptide/nickel transport system permease protein